MRRIAMGAALAGVVLAPASTRAEDTSACIAANEKSIELRKERKLVEALAETAKCSALSCADEVRAICSERAERLSRAIPSIVFDVKDGSGHDLTEVRVTVDGARAAGDPTVSALALDPGPHQFVFEAAGYTLERSFVLREGEQQRHEAIVIGPPPAPAPPIATASPSPGLGAGSPPPAATGGSSPLHTVGIVTGALGLAGLATGGIFGALAASSWSSAQNECPSPANCPQPSNAVHDHDRAASSADVSTIALVAGGALLAAGAVLVLTTGHRASPAAAIIVVPAASPRGGGALVEGRF